MKCLVTKLQGVINNDNLLKLGEFRIKVTETNSPSADSQGITLSFSKDSVVEIIGNGYFTDQTLQQNLGNSMNFTANEAKLIYISNGNYYISIKDKYSLLQFNTSVKAYPEFNINDLRFSKVVNIESYSNKLSGDLSAFIDNSLNYVVLINTSVSGDLSTLNLNSLTRLDINSKLIRGNTSKLANSLNLQYLSLNNTSVDANLEDIKNLPIISTAFLGRNVIGDLSTIPNSIKSVSGFGKVTWTSDRPTSAYIPNIENFNLGNDVDRMLNNLAKCQDNGYGTKYIKCSGTRTSASDAAVATLQQKGYTVSITPA